VERSLGEVRVENGVRADGGRRGRYCCRNLSGGSGREVDEGRER